MKKIVVIGVGGVGMAHVVGAVRSGYEIVSIVDKNKDILERCKKEWKNVWDKITEECTININCKYFTDVENLREKIDFNYCIIATPPNTHISIIKKLREFYFGNILVEKPISNNIIEYNKDIFYNVYVSSEWIYHSKIKNLNEINSLKMQFMKSSTTKWDNYLVAACDFIPHFISVILYKGYKIKDIKFIKFQKDFFKGEIITDKNIIIIQGDRDENGGFFINDKEFKWELNLFDNQLNFNGLSIKDIIQSHNILIERVDNEFRKKN